MKCLLYSLVVLLMPLAVQAQQPRVLYDSRDIENTDDTSSIKKIRLNKMSSYIKVIYHDGTQEKIGKDAIWGIVDKKGNIYRNHKKIFLKVAGIGDVVEYHYYDYDFTGSSAVTIPYSFSKTLDSKIYYSKKKAKRDAATAD